MIHLHSKVRHFVDKRLLFKSENLDAEYADEADRVAVVSYSDANLVSSLLRTDQQERSENQKLHLPVLDIDFEACLEPSTTPGHYHLYLDKVMPWWKYKRLLRALRDAGIIEPGYCRLALKRGATFVRRPGVKKGK